MKPLALTGWGCVSALGTDTASAVQGLREGRCGLRQPRYSPHLGLVATGGALCGEAPVDLPIERRARALLDMALDEALLMAGPADGQVGVFVGTTGGFFIDAEVQLLTSRQTDPTALPLVDQRGQGEVAEYVARRTGARGPVLTYAMACTSGAAALVAAGEHLRAGTCERAIVVGFDPLSALSVQGFRSLMLYDPVPCRPFDVSRAGLQLGEGCGVLVVQPGDGPYHLLGADNQIDPTHLTASATDGSVTARVMRGALERSGLRPDQIVSIKAHGTGTRDNDLAEGRGIVRVFGDEPPPFSSLKGAIGHSLGASGVLEIALWLGALQAGFRPGTVGFSQIDPDIGVAPAGLGPAVQGAHLFGAFGFGGSCLALVVRDA